MPAGRPTRYKKQFNEEARKLCLLGAIDDEIADFFNIQKSTLNRWKKKYPDFWDSIKNGKELADADVAERLYKRAMGYKAIDTKFASFEGKITDWKQYTKEYPPDTVACIFWLKNRQKDKWRDRQQLDIKSDRPILIDLSGKLKEKLGYATTDDS